MSLRPSARLGPGRPAPVGRADLLRFMANEPDPELRAQAAQLLGLPPLPARLFEQTQPPDEAESGQEASTMARGATGHRLPLRCPVLFHAELLVSEADDTPSGGATADTPNLSAWTKRDAAEVEAMLAPSPFPEPPQIPLARMGRLVTRMQQALAVEGGTANDLVELARRVSLARWPWPLPGARWQGGPATWWC